MATIRERLASRLMKKDGHLGREGVEINRLADLSGLSIHTLQSFARGKRNLTKPNEKRLVDAMAGRRTEVEETAE